MVQLLLDVAVASNEARSPREALAICVASVCAYTGWPIGHVYLPEDEAGTALVSSHLWHQDDPARHAVFREISEGFRFPRGVGLPGRVLDSGEPSWIVDVHADPNFPRARMAADIGVVSGFAFPVRLGRRVVAVVEFFATTAREPDPAFLEVMANVGDQLGRVFEREANERMKDQFLGMVSHELRTPLTIARGSLQHLGRLGEAAIAPPGQPYIAYVDRAITRMTALVEDLLQASLLQAGKFSLQRLPIDLTAVVEDACRDAQPLAFGKDVTLERHLTPALPRVWGDPTRLGQVVFNLVHNAIKFSPAGTTVSVTLVQDGASLRCEVQDQGPGIAPEQRASVFERFTRLEETEAEPGVGLGLHIARALCEAHGGAIGHDDGPAGGSTFWFTVPLA